MKENEHMENNLKQIYKTLDQLYQQGDLDQTEAYLLDQEQKNLSEDKNRGILVAVYNEQGSFYRSTSRYRLSIGAFDKARKIITASRGVHCLEYATLINNLAGTYRLAHQYEKAESLFQEAINEYRALGASHSYAFASVHNNISLVYQEMGKTSQAARHLVLATNLIEEMPEHRNELAISYANLTALFHQMGNDKEARECLDEALKIFEECKGTENTHYAAALNSLGGFLYGAGECEKAIDMYKKSAAYTRRFFGENVEVGIAYQNMYWVYRKMNDTSRALFALDQAEKVYLKLFGPEHERTRSVQDERMRLERIQKK
jgi:tetratricopeptide (TPR) repeat protein